MTVKCKTFEMYLREMIYHPERSKKWLADRRLSEIEKTVLRSHLLVRDNKSAEAFRAIESLSQSDIPFVNDQKNLLLGVCLNNMGKYNEAERYLTLARSGFEKSHQYYHLFTTLYNLTMLYRNLGKTSEMAAVVQRMTYLRIDGILPQIRSLRCQCLLALDQGHHDKVKLFIHELKELKSKMSESELGPQLITEFMFYIKNDDLQNADTILNEMKNYRKFTLSENFIFMKGLLSYLKNDSTLYVYQDKFPDPSSDLYYQMKVIEAFQLGDKKEAEKFWTKLQKEYSESLYKNAFEWGGEKCLFSVCLEKNLRKLSTKSPLKGIKGEGPKHQKVFEILSASPIPVKAAEIYEILYDRTVADKDDLKKLVRLIVSVRDFYQVEIVSKKGTYQLIQKENLKKKA